MKKIPESLKVQLLTLDKEEDYKCFINKHEDNFIYATLEFRDFLKESVGGKDNYVIATEGGKVTGVLPLFVKETNEGFKVINSLPWYGSYGGCITSANDTNTVRKKLMEYYIKLVDDDNVISSTFIASPYEYCKFNNFYEKNIIYHEKEIRIGQISTLPKFQDDYEAVLIKSIKQKTRNLVRKSLKQDFQEVVTDEDWAWDFLYKTHEDNMHAVGGKSKPKKHFDAIRQKIPENWRRLSVATLDDIPVAAMLLFKYKNTVEYITPVIDIKYRSQQPLSFLIWKGMLQAGKEHFTRWNWGATWESQASLHHFKAGWGAEDYRYGYFISTSSRQLTFMKDNMDQLSNWFPYYYIYPFTLLEN